MAGYSQTPLAKKLGIKNGHVIQIINEPEHYRSLLTDLPDGLGWNGQGKKDLIHFFIKSKSELEARLPGLKKELKPNGMIWVSWPKKAAKIATDVDENVIRNLALSTGLVDVKVCAVDDIWSGLKLVIPTKDRTSA